MLLAVLLLGACALTEPAAPTAAPTPSAAPGSGASPAAATATAAPSAPATASIATTATGSAAGVATAPTGAPATATMTAAGAATPAPRLTPTPRGEQTLTLAGGLEAPATFDPALIQDAAASFLARQAFGGLVKLDERLEPVADLAVALPTISADRLTYRFALRPDAVFHDGTPVTAAAVKESLERATDPRLAADGDGLRLPAATYLIDIKGAAERLRGGGGSLDGVRVVGPLDLELTLAAPQATFLLKLTHTTAAVVDVRQVGDRAWWRKPNGTGPFRLEEWRDGERLSFRRWERYHGGPATLERVVWLLGASASSPLNLYEGGKIDLIDLGTGSIDRALTPGSALNRDLRVVPQLSLTYLAFNVREPPFDDVNVRRAFARAVDRDRIARVTFEGKVQRAEGLVPPALPGALPAAAVVERAAELAEARRLLEGSRYGSSLPRARLYVTGGGLGGTLREVYERDLGVPVDVIAATWNDFLDGLNRREYPAYLLTWLADYPDPQSFVETLFHSASPENRINYANPRVDALLEQAARSADPGGRAELYRQAQRLILDDAVVVPLYVATDYTVVKPHVKGLMLTPLGIIGLERVWLER